MDTHGWRLKTMIDVTKAIEPKSDQQNADSLLSGPRTIKIRDIAYNPTAESQPLWIYFEGDEGKPWKPCRTAARVLVSIWGPDAKKWIGLHCTIYNDPDVVFGGAKVGGIRVSHMEGLSSPRTLMLTKTRGKKGATVIKPLEVEAAASTESNPVLKSKVDRDALREEAAGAKLMGAEQKREWWASKTDEERAVLKELAQESDPQ